PAGAETWPIELRPLDLRVPFAELGESVEYLADYFVEGLGAQTLGQRVNRLHKWQGVEFVRLDDEVGVGDLLLALEEADFAGDVALLTDRQGPFHPPALRPEEHQLDIPGIVMGEHPVRDMRLAAGRRLVPVDMQFQ